MKFAPIALCVALLTIPVFAQTSQPTTATAPATFPDVHAGDVFPDPVIRLARLGKYDDALRLGKETVDALSGDAGKSGAERAHAMANLAVVYIAVARYSDAKTLLTDAEKLINKDDRPSTLARADVQEAQGNLAFETGDYETAATLSAKVLDARRKLLPNDDPLVLDAMEEMAMANVQNDKPTGADRQLNQVLRMRTAKFGAESLPVADTNSARGFYYMNAAEDPARARAAYQKCLDVRRKLLGNKHVDIADCLYGLAQIDTATSKDDDARQKLEQARDILRDALGKDHPYVAYTDESLAACYAKAGDDKKALTIAAEASDICLKKFGPAHAFYADALEQQSDVLRGAGEAEKADELDKKVEDIRSKLKKNVDL